MSSERPEWMDDPRVVAAVGHGPEGWERPGGWRETPWQSGDWRVSPYVVCYARYQNPYVKQSYNGDPADAIARIAAALPVLRGDDEEHHWVLKSMRLSSERDEARERAEKAEARVAELHGAVDVVFQHEYGCWPCWCSERRNDDGTFKAHEKRCPRHLKKLLGAPDAD